MDRETSLRRAEKLLRQGRLDGAIEEYERLVEDQPHDWNTRNLLGDLLVRGGQIEKAVSHFTNIADHFAAEGFLPRAIALYKKVVKIKPDDEHSLLQSAEIAARQGLLVDAKACLSAIADQRRRRGDMKGAGEIVVRIGALDPADFAARLTAARAVADSGDGVAAAARYEEIATDLFAKDRAGEAIQALVEAVRLDGSDAVARDRLFNAHLQHGNIEAARACAVTSAQRAAVADELLSRGRDEEAATVLAEALAADPSDAALRGRLVRVLIAAGKIEQAMGHLTEDVAGDHGDLMLLAAEVRLRAGDIEHGRALLCRIRERSVNGHENLMVLGCALADVNPDAAFECIDVAADAAIADRDWPAAAAVLQEFLRRVPGYMAALIKLVDVCVDGNLQEALFAAQSDLADCYLAAGRAGEASVIAEDLLMRARGDTASIARFRHALEMLGEPNAEAIVAERAAAATSLADGFDLDAPPSTLEDLPLQDHDRASAPGEKGERRPDEVQLEAPQPGDAEADAISAVENPDERTRVAMPAPAGSPLFDTGEPGGRIDPSGTAPEVIELDLTAALADLKAAAVPEQQRRPAPVVDLDAVFQDFRNEVLREDTTTSAGENYKLALAYLDLGMADESMRALEMAVRAPRYRFQAASLLGELCRREGRTDDAIEWFERAAESPASSADAARALLYELGQTLENAGEAVRALAVYLELQADAGEYRDVRARIGRLSQPAAGD